MLRSPVLYHGGKARLAPVIAAALPDHTRYVEPFAGSLSVLLAKLPSRVEIANDLDGNLSAFWRVLRDRPTELARACLLTPHSREERALAHDLDVADDLERARRVFVALTQGRTSTLKRTGWRHAVSEQEAAMAPRLRRYAGRIEAAAVRLANVSLECRDAREVIRDYDSGGTVMYVDPPYLAVTRTSNNYGTEMHGEDQHRELAETLHGTRATVLLSGYRSTVYDDLYRDWFRYELPAATTQGGTAGHRTEVIWTNRENPSLKALTDAECDGFPPLCARCERVVPRPKRGPRGRWCSAACRTAAWRDRKTADTPA
ncbi:DNA adenine methylase [Mycobacteroides abscessus]|uniref:DNA adenine methylase n=1 Tax=Mycobacteroides abscessus TaxID=36809 RepID=UPI0009291C4A|nr:DNA adenine methylase [Mycobacteroides abscessus]SHX64587.1 D12 class N6 adenine-specific DNA methyltransferase [Mycobacteroides abscessus subsp. abscessus]SHZ18389.1 D12 class N6 adenine-specific DNA methyltransferase [Mycobacteroides abscessus subsp. abscessus]SIB50829.1 D12 class N6 adenine-specific DNA methyltransferase [Mycobacteroides abscessus subsp. abscessus]SIF18874.1 D12 class N6 adenine-specific DNA methyltransferase [Mycobacteroides abscessus subsp. abscessus]SKI48377.1 D12 cla